MPTFNLVNSILKLDETDKKSSGGSSAEMKHVWRPTLFKKNGLWNVQYMKWHPLAFVRGHKTEGRGGGGRGETQSWRAWNIDWTFRSQPRHYCYSLICETKIKQDYIPVGCIPPACLLYLPACTAQGGVCLVCLGRGVSPCQGGLLARRMVSQHTMGQTPLWTEFLTHACENITLAQTSFACGNNRREQWEQWRHQPLILELKPIIR